MAHVEKRQRRRPDGTLGPVRWRVRWRDPAGTERSRTFVLRRDATAWATQKEHEVLSGAYVDHVAGRETLRAYAERWRSNQVWAPSTAERVEIVFRLHLYPVLGDHPLAAIRTSDVQAWVKGLTKTQKPSTVKVVASNLSGVMKAALMDRLISVNPCTGVKLPKADRTEVVPPTPAELELLLGQADDRWFALLVALSGLGLRISEALALTVDRVNFLGRTVRIDQQVEVVKGEGVRMRPVLKSETSHRTIPLPAVVADALAAHLARWPAGPGGAIFHDHGRLIRRQRANQAIDRARAKANAPASKKDLPLPLPERFHPHDLRHFYASLLIAKGASPKTVQKRMGHASIVETMDTYGHLWPDSDDETRDAVDEVLGPLAAQARPTGTG